MSGTGLRCEVREKRVTRGDAINRDASCVFGFARSTVALLLMGLAARTFGKECQSLTLQK
jgi:hypothetical protein